MSHIVTHVTGQGAPPIVFVHGFACDHTDWDAQVAWFAQRHRTVTVDLPGHGNSPGEPDRCSIERFGSELSELLRTRVQQPVVLIGHSMGCRVVTEAALQNPESVAGVVLVDGSQFTPAMQAVLRASFASDDSYTALIGDLFKDMFTSRSDKAIVSAIIARAHRLPRPTGEKLLTDLQRYDVYRLTASLGCLRVPVMAIQTTTRDQTGRQTPLRSGQSTPYLTMLRTAIPSVQIEIIPETGHFPQIDEPRRTAELLDEFVASFRSGPSA